MARLYPTTSDAETFLLVELRSPREPAGRVELRLAELARLVESAGGQVADTTTVLLRSVDPGHYISRRRCEQIAEQIAELGVTGVVFDAPLTPAQSRNLERLCEAKVLDRTAVILDIFARRARTHEGRLQVELAQLRYLLPRLTGRGRAMSRLGGGIGTRGPGETKLETDRRRILARIGQLQNAIQEIRRHRATQRSRRLRATLPTAAVVGYTNAGKSTLINRLTGSDIFTADQLFATLDPTTRALTLPHGIRVAVIDTVGFIRDLPQSLTVAFRATLEEMEYADLLIEVVDASSPNREEELQTTDQILATLDLAKIPRLLVWNKIDRLDAEEEKDDGPGAEDKGQRTKGNGQRTASEGRETGGKTRAIGAGQPNTVQLASQGVQTSNCPQVEVSALTGEGIDRLLHETENVLTREYLLDTFLVPYDSLDQLAELRARGQVISERYEESGLRVTARVPPALAARFRRYEVDGMSRKRQQDDSARGPA